jgi:hypothetical protein
MAEPRESSAIIRFIHRQGAPILTAEHAIETQVVRNPLQPAVRRSRLGPALIALAVAAAFAVVTWFAFAGGARERRAAAASPPAPTAAPIERVAPDPAPAPAEPVVIAMADADGEGDDSASAGEVDAVPGEAGEIPDDEADGVTDAELAPQTTPKLKRRVRRDGSATRPRTDRAARRRTKVAPPPNMGSKGVLMIASKPPCRILINDRDTGLTTPQRDIQLIKGRHKVTLVNREHGIESTLSVNIHPGKRVRVVRDLTDRMKGTRRR